MQATIRLASHHSFRRRRDPRQTLEAGRHENFALDLALSGDIGASTSARNSFAVAQLPLFPVSVLQRTQRSLVHGPVAITDLTAPRLSVQGSVEPPLHPASPTSLRDTDRKLLGRRLVRLCQSLGTASANSALRDWPTAYAS